MSFDEIKKYVSDNNHILLSTEYNNNKEKLNFICNNGHEYQTSFSQFKSGKRCSTCSKRKKYTLNDITSFIEKEGL
jgi:transcription initiation factor IIE alpha subunit